MEIKDINAYHKNPRKITKEKFELLSQSMKKYGDLSGIVVNIRTGEAVGGNQRTNFFKTDYENCVIEITEKLEKPTPVGTVAYGFVKYGGEKYNYREVDWDEKTAEGANVSANKIGGMWDFDILGNEFDTDLLLESGFEKFELSMNDKDKIDTDDLGKSLDSYLDGNIRQIVLYFDAEQFNNVMPRLEAIMKEKTLENHTDMFMELLNSYENTPSN